jgi:hypothetical protein
MAWSKAAVPAMKKSQRIIILSEIIRELSGLMPILQKELLPSMSLAQFHVLDRLAKAENGTLLQSDLQKSFETAGASGLSMLLKRMAKGPKAWITPKSETTGQGRLKKRRTSIKITSLGVEEHAKAREEYEANILARFRSISEHSLLSLYTAVGEFRAGFGVKREHPLSDEILR